MAKKLSSPLFMASHNPNRHTQLPAYSLLSPDLPSHELPQYSTVVSRQSSSSAGVLPRYSTLEPSNSVARSLSRRAEHTFCSTFRNDSATLTVLSSAKSFQNTPRFSGGDNVAGTLSLSLENGESIHAVTISVSLLSSQKVWKIQLLVLVVGQGSYHHRSNGERFVYILRPLRFVVVEEYGNSTSHYPKRSAASRRIYLAIFVLFSLRTINP